MAPTKIDLESIDPAACARLHDLIVSKRDEKTGKVIVQAPFATHLPALKLKSWLADEFDRNEIEALLTKLGEALVEKYQAEEKAAVDAAALAPTP